MKKRGEKKHKKKITRTVSNTHVVSSDEKLEKILVENFVSLQKVMVNLSVKFDALANQLSKLLNLFEISAKALAEKDFKRELENKDAKEIVKKVDNLLEQNKIIARGLTLLHEKPEESVPSPSQGAMPGGPRRFRPSPGIEEYQKSISSAETLEPSPISEDNQEE